MEDLPREVLVERAQLARQARQHDVVVELMSLAAKKHSMLSKEERDLLFDGCSNLIASRISRMRGIGQDLTAGNDVLEEEVKRGYRNMINTAEQLLKSARDPAAKMFYHKMRGDCYWNLSELEVGSEKDEASDLCLKAYKIALTIAKGNVSPTNETMLGLVFNFSTLYYESLDLPERACQLMSFALEQAQLELSSLNGYSSEESTLILQRMKETLDQWTSNFDGDSNNFHKAVMNVNATGKYKKNASGNSCKNISHVDLRSMKFSTPPIYRERPEATRINFKGQTVRRACSRPNFGYEQQAQPQALAPENPSSGIHSYSQEKDRIRHSIRTIEDKIREEGKVPSLRKLGRGKIYLKGLSQKLQSEEARENP